MFRTVCDPRKGAKAIRMNQQGRVMKGVYFGNYYERPMFRHVQVINRFYVSHKLEENIVRKIVYTTMLIVI